MCIRDSYYGMSQFFLFANTSGINYIFYYERKVYIGQTGRLISTRVQEHVRHTKNSAVEKSAIAEHSALTNHMVNFEDASVIRSCNRYYDRLIPVSYTHLDVYKRQPYTLQTPRHHSCTGLTCKHVWV